jgi:hypothetical protein
MFQWLEGAASVGADWFRNCALEVRAGGSPRTLALRKPQQVEPITMDLLRPAALSSLAVDWLPDPALLRLEIIRMEGRDGLVVAPPGPLALKSPVTLGFPRMDKQGRLLPGGVRFEVRFAQRGARLAIELHQPKAQAAEFKMFPLPQPAREKIQEGIQGLNRALDGAQAEKKPPIQQSLNLAQAQLWYDDFFKAVHRKARLHFRVLADLGDYQLELARTEPP